MSPPRRPRGTHWAQGLVWPPGTAPTDARTWHGLLQSDDIIVDLEGVEGWRAVVFASPRRVHEVPLGADILRSAGAGLSTLEPPGALGHREVVVGHHGQRVVCRLGTRPVDAAALFSLGEITIVRMRSVGQPPPVLPPRATGLGVVSARLGLRTAQAAESSEEVAVQGSRSRVGDWLASAGARVLREVLALFEPEAQPKRQSVPRGTPVQAGAPRRSRLGDLIRGLWTGLGSVGVGLGVILGFVGSVLRQLWPGARSPSRAAQPGPLASLWARLRARVPMWAMFRWMQRRHAQIFEELLDRFAHGDLLEALRHAVPLGGDGAAPPDGWFFGRLGRRAQLNLSARKSAGAVAAADQVLGLLRRTYEAAHKTLDADGDVERAAWVLAELLRQPDQAVAYLESKGEWARAAEWSELLDLSTETSLRLWVLAGNIDHAVILGLSRGVLDATLLVLSTQAPEVAAQLRGGVADHRWASGQEEAAVHTLWPDRDGDDGERLRQWVADALGRARTEDQWAVAAALGLGLVPDPRGVVDGVLGQSPLARSRLVDGLVRFGPLSEEVCDPVLRALLLDVGMGDDGRAAGQIRRLLDALGTGQLPELRADLPPLPPADTRDPAPWTPSGGGEVTSVEGTVPGERPILDVHLDAHGVLTVALGDLGLWRVQGDGAPAHVPTAVDRLLPGPETLFGVRQRPGGPAWLWSLRTGMAPVPAGELPPGLTVSPELDSDGVLWAFGDGAVSAWRLGRAGPERLWTSGRVGEHVRALEVTATLIHAVVDVGRGAELWCWSRSVGPTLRSRSPLEGVENGDVCTMLGGKVHVQRPAGVWLAGSDARVSGGRILGVVGATVAVSAEPHTVSLWAGRAAWTLEGDPGAVLTCVRMLPGQRLLVGWGNGRVHRVDLPAAAVDRDWLVL